MPVSSCQRQLAQFVVTNDDTDVEIGSSKMFKMQVQQLRQQQQHQQQHQQQPSSTCTCQPQRPWQPSSLHSPLTSEDNSAAAFTASSLPPSSPLPRHHQPYVTGVLITPASLPAAEAVPAPHEVASCSHDALAGGAAAEVLATEWEVMTAVVLTWIVCSRHSSVQVYVTIKNNVAGGIRYLSRVHGPLIIGGTASVTTGNWFCGRVKGGRHVKIRWGGWFVTQTARSFIHDFLNRFSLGIQ